MQSRHGHDTLAALILAVATLAQLPACDPDKDPTPSTASATATDTGSDSAGDSESCEASGEGTGTGDTGATSQAGSCGAEDGSPTTGSDDDGPAGLCEGERCIEEMGIYCAPGLECVTWDEENGPAECRKPCHFQAGECGDGFDCNFQPSGKQPRPYCDARPGMCGDSTAAPR